MWLLDRDIQIRCFKATPYSLGSELFLQIEQIIPLPETAEYMIDAMEKQKEKKVKSKKVEKTKSQLISLWSKLKEELSFRKLNYLDNVSAKPYFFTGFSKGKAPAYSYQGIITGGTKALDGGLAGQSIGDVLGQTSTKAKSLFKLSNQKKVIDEAVKIIAGSARSMGIEVKD